MSASRKLCGNEPPTADECSSNQEVHVGDKIGRAIWYPQMGGYGGKAVVFNDDNGGCFSALVWHDGEFPFGHYADDPAPVRIHHCMAEQFIRFGETVGRLFPECAPDTDEVPK